MARGINTDEHEDYGEPVKYDPTFKGPLNKRSCTDVICLGLFLVFVGAWIFVGCYGFTQGDPSRLLLPTDSQGRKCGLDTEVIDKPYLFFFDLTRCIRSNVVLNGCPTPQVCVESCPEINFFYSNLSSLEAIKRDIKCKTSINVSSISTVDEFTGYVDREECARYYLSSKAVSNRCIPLTSVNNFTVVFVATFSELTKLVHNLIMEFTDSEKVHEIGHMMVQDLSYTWPYIVAAFSLAMVLCLVYIVLMRWFAGIMVWVSIAGVVGLLSYCVYVTYVKFVDLRDNPISQAEKESLGEVDSLLALKNTWLVFLIISAVTLIIVLLILLFLRKRINVAVALIKEGSKAVGSITSTLIFPLVPWVLECGVVAYSIATALYLASCSDPVYKITGITNTSCVCPEIKDGDICDLNIFNVTTNCTGTCIGVSCQFFRYQTPRTIDYLHAVNIFGFFWGLFFVSALGEMILAATFATWYWTFHKSNVPFFTLTISAGRTLRYHLGTLAFGSLILAICRIIRVILEYVNHKLSKYDNVVVKACMCCLRCFFWCLEKFIKFINRNAYIMCAIHGKNFCRSAKDAFNLLMRNVVRVFVVDKVTDFLLFLGKLMITAGVVALAFFVFDGQVIIPETKLPTLNYYLLPVIIIAVGTYFIACLFFNVYAMAVDTLFLCFLEDCERNDGSLEKPYFMSKSLMKVLHKKNKKD